MAPRISKTTPVDKKRPKARARKPKQRPTIETTGETVPDHGTFVAEYGPPATPATPPTNGVHVNGVTPATTNGAHVNGVTNGVHTNGVAEHVPGTPEQIESVAAAVLDASRTGDPRDAHALAKQLPTGAAGDVVGWCLPEAWRDEACARLLARLGDDDAALILAWLTCQWWEGYNVGHLHGMTGEDLRK